MPAMLKSERTRRTPARTRRDELTSKWFDSLIDGIPLDEHVEYPESNDSADRDVVDCYKGTKQQRHITGTSLREIARGARSSHPLRLQQSRHGTRSCPRGCLGDLGASGGGE